MFAVGVWGTSWKLDKTKDSRNIPFETVTGRHHLFAVGVWGTLWKLDKTKDSRSISL